MKTTEKSQPATQRDAGPSRDDIRTAYEIHTLAHILYGQMAMNQPWMGVPPSMRGIQQMPQPMPPMPMSGAPWMPWLQEWPVPWGYPQRWGW